MVIQFLKAGTPFQQVSDAFVKIENQKEVKGILMLSADKNAYSKKELDPLLLKAKVPLFGGLFPQIIYQQNNYDEGLLILGLESEPRINIIPNLSDPDVDFEDYMEDCKIDSKTKTAFIAVDGYSLRIQDFIESFFNFYGLEFNIIGGAAGSLSLEQKPCLYTNKGVLKDVGVLAIFNVQSGVAVRHGWKDLSGPYKVSESEKNRLYKLDNETAFDLYKRVVEEDSKQLISKDNFLDIAKAYPFGISRLGAEKIVRDPFSIHTDGSINCLGEIPQGAYLHILKGDVNSLIQSAGEAFKEAEKSMETCKKQKSILLIDCITRALFLEDLFIDELNAVSKKGCPLIGALTLGEIANNQKEYLEFYNKTVVVSIIEGL